MLQILRQRKFDSTPKPVFVYTEPVIHVPTFTALIESYAKILDQLTPEERWNLYYTLAHHSIDKRKSLPSRSAATFESQTILAWDIDHVDSNRLFEYATIAAGILKIPRDAFIMVNSGNGLHLIVNLQNPIRHVSYFSDNKAAYVEICRQMTKAFIDAGLPPESKTDTTVFDPARVLRLPGSTNKKPSIPDKECVLLQSSRLCLDLDLMLISGLDKYERENISPKEIKRSYPTPDFKEIVKECRFVKWALEKPLEVHEPHLFDLLGILGVQTPAQKAFHDNREMTAVEIGQWVFDHAGSSQSLKRSDFQDKWEQSARYGTRKCQTIDERSEECKACPHFGKIVTPLALRSKSHIGSAELGYWVLGSRGQHLHPNYGDLAKLFVMRQSYVTTPDERLLGFRETHYGPIPDIDAKAWIENTVVPSDPLRETHRNEFLHKISVVGRVSAVSHEDLFERTVKGKLNCRNGILDIITGEFMFHSPTFGFQYCLPYDYDENATSEYFLDWLGTITESRPELMESILDIMAYCLWPTYEDHMFAYFVGEGANGKSTLIDLIKEIVGRNNYSSISAPQITRNRFAPAALEGKLVNLAEEASAYVLDVEQLNVIKTLSAGGELFIEEKNKQGYSFKNKAKLIFLANKPPQFKESGHAVRRRLVVIPFDYLIKSPDHSVWTKLKAEVPGILNLLVRRIRENVTRNGGQFKVYRGGAPALKAQRKILAEGNTVVDWAREEIESSADIPVETYIRADDAYAKYRQWCEDSGVDHPQHKKGFGLSMQAHVLTGSEGGSTIIRVAGVPMRVYRRTKFRQELIENED